ncbi:MAG: DNA repair protein RecO [Verrucomicrobiota bacterium]
MDERATGIILRTRPYTDTSVIVHWLTPDLGRLATLAKGARRPKSPLRGKLDLFFHADFSFQRSRRSDLHALREVVVKETHPSLRRDLSVLQQAAYGSALLEQITETETPLPELFPLFQDYLASLESGEAAPVVVFAYELKLLVEQGFQPSLKDSRLSLGAQRILEQLQSAGWPAVRRFHLTRAQQGEISIFLRHCLEQSFERIPATRDDAVCVE